jgi:endonuclease/exonuclease/phosphatase family metal-dependent hydrolase
MINRLFTKRRVVSGQEIAEPTIAAIVLTALLLTILLGLCAAGIFLLYPFAHGWWVLTIPAVLLAGFLFLRPRRQVTPATHAQLWMRRVLGAARKLFVAVLACWLGLLLWCELSPGGPPPAAKEDQALIRVVTWNVHCGSEGGPLWERFDWAGRKYALQTAVQQARPDILCVQEARAEQVQFLERALPRHQRVGVGRDDGRSGGEHCAIYFDRDRFEEIGSGTFWLEDPVDEPGKASALSPRRICTWVRLRDRQSGRVLRVYNSHLYLTEEARRRAARIILARIAEGDPSDAVILTADFNAPPNALSRQLFTEAGLADSANLAGKSPNTPTYHCYGLRLRCLDSILVSPGWRAHNHAILDVKPDNVFPSDHFGVLTDLALKK